MRTVACIILVVISSPLLAAEGGNIFTSKDHGFSMKAPLDKESVKLAIFFLAPSNGFAPNVNIQKQAFSGTIQDYDKISTGQFKKLKFEMINRTLRKDEVVYEYKGETRNRQMHWYARAIMKGNSVYLVTATCLESQWEKRKAKLIKSVNSFKFEK